MAAFDALTTASVADELQEKLAGGRIQDVVQPDPQSIGLEVYARHTRQYVLFSIHPQEARVHLIDQRPRRGVEVPSPLLLLLRKYAIGARIDCVTHPPYERILRVGIDHPEHGTGALIAEIMGRRSNLILVDGVGNIRDSLKRVGPDVNRVRVILPGQPYYPPPPQDKLPPDQVTPQYLQEAFANLGPRTPLWRALVQTVAGISSQAARELAVRSAGDPQAPVVAADAYRLKEELDALWEPQHTGVWEPHIARQGDTIVAYAPYRITHLGQATPVESISQAIVMYHAQGRHVDAYAGLRSKVAREIAAARERLERRQKALRRQWVEPQEVQRLRQSGEWLLALAHQVQPGQEELIVDTGEVEPLRIALDPRRSAVENAQDYFTRYRKAQRAAEEIPRQLAEVERDLAYLDQLVLELEMANSQPEIAAVREALAAAGYLPKKPRRSAPPPGPIKVTTTDGFAILVGRNSRQNEEITFRIAAPDDLWLHARGVPGAHVIIRGGGRSIPPSVIQRAAELAAYYSAARGEPEVLVSVVPRRRVRRLPGGHPGQVTYTGEETVRVHPRP
ncbi:MAG: NFACT family protein [Anaerolineae bacterium]|nr:NFACT family protein [Anaerolineae bacterium]